MKRYAATKSFRNSGHVCSVLFNRVLVINFKMCKMLKMYYSLNVNIKSSLSQISHHYLINCNCLCEIRIRTKLYKSVIFDKKQKLNQPTD